MRFLISGISSGRWCQLLAAGAVCLLASELAAQDQGPKPVDFVRDIRPILARNCYECHGPDEGHRKGDLRLDTSEGAFAKRDDTAAFVPKDVGASEALRRILSTDAGEQMPPPKTGKTLNAEQIDLLKRWIEQGAPWRSHWAFERPVRREAPAVKDANWPVNDIDRFVLARLEQEGLTPSPAADKRAIARRVALDLTGLPPDPDVVQEFLADNSAEAYEKLVDRLLQSNAYGERWTRLWLDLARYADTRGYEKDRSRTIWRYRDWLIYVICSSLSL